MGKASALSVSLGRFEMAQTIATSVSGQPGHAPRSPVRNRCSGTVPSQPQIFDTLF
jgi:hypothetical protein